MEISDDSYRERVRPGTATPVRRYEPASPAMSITGNHTLPVNL